MGTFEELKKIQQQRTAAGKYSQALNKEEAEKEAAAAPQTPEPPAPPQNQQPTPQPQKQEPRRQPQVVTPPVVTPPAVTPPAPARPVTNASPVAVAANGLSRKWKVGIIAAVVVLLAVNAGLFVLFSSSRSDKITTSKTLQRIEDGLKANVKQSNNFSSDLRKMSEEIKTTNVRVKELNEGLKGLESSKDAQTAAIDNLTKAKNTLFNRVSSVEAEVASARQARLATSQEQAAVNLGTVPVKVEQK